MAWYGKTRGERFEQALAFIQGVFPGTHGNFCRKIVENRLDAVAAPLREAIGDAMSIPDSVQGQQERDGLRAVVLLRLLVKKEPAALAPSIIAAHAGKTAAALQATVRGLVPMTHDSPSRATWSPAGFTTTPTANAPAPSRFRYIVFGISNAPPPYGTSFADIIKDPTILRTWMISSSVIDERRTSTYYPYGLILHVPVDCVLTTSGADQGFTNYPKTTDPTRANWENMDPQVHVREVLANNPELLTPDEVLNAKVASSGKYGYNEVTLLGTAPSGAVVTPTAFFMKVDSQGDRYEFKKGDGPPGPYVTDPILKQMGAAALPIVTIPDASGANG